MMWLLFVPFSAVGLEGTATALRWPPGERSCGRGVRAPARPPPRRSAPVGDPDASSDALD